MKREDFIKKGLGSLGLFAIIPALSSCKKDSVVAENSSSTVIADPTVTPSSCSVTNSETAGPFPTKSPTSFAVNNIVTDRKGTPLTIKVYIRNVNANCAVLKDAIVDIWHCDAAGLYSQYGGTGLQSANMSAVNFLRGRQTTDTNGMATWTSIYPGWYPGRAPHIHVHIYNGSGTSLLVTQIAFPEDVSKVVYAQGVYASKGQADRTNANDNVFRDGFANQMSVVTGNASTGYVLTHTIFVKA